MRVRSHPCRYLDATSMTGATLTHYWHCELVHQTLTHRAVRRIISVPLNAEGWSCPFTSHYALCCCVWICRPAAGELGGGWVVPCP